MQFTSLQHIAVPELISLWNAALGDRFPMREALLRRNLFGDLNFLPDASFAAKVDGRLVGFVAVKLNREFIGHPVKRMGYINSLIVHPDYQRRGIGTALFQCAMAGLRTHNPAAVHIGRDTFHFFPGVPQECPDAQAFFAKMGAQFEAAIQTDLVGDIRAFELPEAVRATLKREGAEVRPCKPEEVPALAEHLRLAFPGRWQYEFNKFIYDGGNPADYIVVVEQGKVIGFCHIYTPESVWIGPNTYWGPLYKEDRFGGLGPLGVDKSCRGRGLGLAVVACAVEELKRRSITRAGIDWTTLVDFYRLLGFEPWKNYLSAQLKLA